jgi:hypothetical protein
LVFATRRFDFDLALDFRTGFRAATFFLRADEARLFGFATFFLALRFFAMVASVN